MKGRIAKDCFDEDTELGRVWNDLGLEATPRGNVVL